MTAVAHGTGRVAAYLRFIKVEHSLFALPFIAIGALMGFAATGRNAWAFAEVGTWALVLLAAVAARTAAMSLNRIIDRAIDARNPRTATRELPSGVLRAAEAWALVGVTFGLLFFAAWRLNPLCLALAPVLVVLFTVYPYMKRWHWSAHVVLGASLACGAAGGFLAITGSFGGALATAVLSAAVLLWVTGFDVLYALLDVEFDRANGLHSVPARFGAPAALTTARGLHALVVLLLAAFGYLASMGWPYWVAWGIVAAVLHVEHRQARTLDPGAINRAFFHLNAVVGWVLLAGVVAAEVLA